MKKVLVISSKEDAHWEGLYEAASLEEQKALLLFPVDQINKNAFIEYNPVNQIASFVTSEYNISEKAIQSIWYRRLPIPNNLIDDDNKILLYCRNEYIKLFENLEFALPTRIRWISKPSMINRAKNKAYQLKLAKRIGFNLPEMTLFTNNPDSIINMNNEFNFNFIYKSIKTPNIETDDGKILTVWTSKLDKEDFENRDRLRLCPGILQSFVNKKNDIRVCIFGNEIFATEIFSQEIEIAKVDNRLGGSKMIMSNYYLTDDIKEKCLKIIKQLGLSSGEIDLALMEDGSYVFFEVNSNGQWLGYDKDNNQPMRRAMLDLLFNN